MIGIAAGESLKTIVDGQALRAQDLDEFSSSWSKEWEVLGRKSRRDKQQVI